MSYMWVIPAVVVVISAIITARLSAGLSIEAALAEAELAEAAEAIDVVGGFTGELSGTTVRIELLIATLRSPLRAVRQARRTVRHWWSRARRRMPAPDVPSTP